MTTLEELNLRYAVIGGLALAQWGVVRATYDVDLKVLVPDSNYGYARLLLERALPEPGRPQLPDNPLIVSRRVTGVIVDFLLALPGYEAAIVERAVDYVQEWIAEFAAALDQPELSQRFGALLSKSAPR